MELFLLYLWLKLDVVCTALLVLFILGMLAYTMGWIQRSIEDYDNSNYSGAKKFCYWHTKLLFISLFSGLFLIAIPSSKDVAILVGASVALDIAKSPEGAKIGQLLRGKANELLDAELKKLQPSK